jgi:hypothetical protein
MQKWREKHVDIRSFNQVQILMPQLKYVSMLSDDMKKSISYYTTYNYDRINRNMRNGTLDVSHLEVGEADDEIMKQDIENINNLMKIFEGIPDVQKSFMVYRGTSCIKDYDEDVFIAKSFISTTINLDIVPLFSNECVLYIDIPIGMKVLPVWEVSSNPNEMEIILHPDTKFVKERRDDIHKSGINRNIYVRAAYA